MRAAAPRLIGLFAPPGYGKQRIARLFAQGFESHEIVDAVEVDEAAIARWERASGTHCLVVMRGEALDDCSIGSLIGQLLARRAAPGAIVLVSRREPSGVLFQHVEPREFLALRVADLELTLADMRELAADLPVADDTLDRIYHLSGGWPAVAQYLLAVHSRGTLTRDLVAIRHRWHDLFDWCEGYLRDTLDAQAYAAMIDGTVRMDGTVDQIADRGMREAAMRLVNQYHLADVGISGELRINAFARLTLHVRAQRELIEAAYRILHDEGSENPIAAARALINVGELRRAETLLEPLDVHDVLRVGEYAYPGMLLELLTPVVPPYYLYPRLWLALAVPRSFTQSAVTIGEEGSEVLAHSDQGDLVPWIRFCTAMAMVRAGMQNVALNLAEELMDDDDQSLGAALGDIILEMVDAYNGRYARAMERWQRSGPALQVSPSLYAFGMRVYIRATTASGALAIAAERARLMISLSCAGTSPFVYVGAVVDAAFIAWLSGDDEAFERYRYEAKRALLHYEAPIYWRALAAMFGLAPSGPEMGDIFLKTLALVMLATYERPDSEQLLTEAIALSDRSRGVWLRCVTRIVAAAKCAQHRDEFLAEALEIARAHDAQTIVVSVERILAHAADTTPFGALLRRVAAREPQPLPAPAGGLYFDVTSGRLTSDGRPLKLSDGTLQLLTALCVHGGSASRERLTELLWPDLDGASAQAALKMCVHRARLQLADAHAVAVVRGSYSLGAHVRCNYEMLSGTAAAPARSECELALNAFWNGGECAWAQWSWFAPYARALGDAAQIAAERLVHDALAAGENERALRVAHRMAAERPLDERPARALIGVYLAMREEAQARRVFSDYERSIREELGTAPSAELAKLLRPA